MSQKRKLYQACCLALLVTSLSFGIRAGILGVVGIEFELNNAQLAYIAATAFWGFPIATILGGYLMDYIPPKRLLVFTFACHLVALVMMIFAGGYYMLWLATLLTGLANGGVAAVCNPLIVQLYPADKTAKLNLFHLWFPGGMVLSALVVLVCNAWGFSWQWQLAVMCIPLLAYGYLIFMIPVPFQPLRSKDLGMAQFKSLFHPLYLLTLILMMGTSVTELFVTQWVEVLLHAVYGNAILILLITSGVMVLGRAFASRLTRYFSPLGLLFASSVVSVLGLWLLAHTQGAWLCISAFIFGLGICFLGPTMIGFAADTFPKTGALGIALLGAIGMVAVSMYTHIMGEYYDDIILKQLPKAANLIDFQNAESGSVFASRYQQAKRAAGPEILKATLFIPIALAGVFGIWLVLARRHHTK